MESKIQMQRQKMGGKSPLRIFLKGNDDLTSSLPSREKGGKLERGLRELLRDKYNGAFHIEIIHESGPPSDLLEAPFPRRLLEEPIDVVVFSLQPEILRFESPVEQVRENFLRLVRSVKERLSVHVIAYNCSTFDPKDQAHNYHGLEDTLALRVHKCNLALMEISTLEGISIVDVDRLIAHLGGGRHVPKALSYSDEAYGAMCEEFLRVLEDIGFFENRPLVMQIGQRREVKRSSSL